MGKRKIDRDTLLGGLVAVSGVVAGLLLDGGSIRQIIQPSAALIVLGGTLGAILIQFPLPTVQEAARQVRDILFHSHPPFADCIEEVLDYCVQARRHGLLILDAHLDRIEDAFLRKSLTLAVDGVKAYELRSVMEVDLDLHEEREGAVVSVLEAAGGFAPTLGIIGAVVGLIQVMQRMSNVEEIGKGIAVAFVSTLYGIGVANLLFLPLAGKLRTRMRERQLVREMTLEGVVSIVEGITTRALKERLQSYLIAGKVEPQPQAEPEMAAL